MLRWKGTSGSGAGITGEFNAEGFRLAWRGRMVMRYLGRVD